MAITNQPITREQLSDLIAQAVADDSCLRITFTEDAVSVSIRHLSAMYRRQMLTISGSEHQRLRHIYDVTLLEDLDIAHFLDAMDGAIEAVVLIPRLN